MIKRLRPPATKLLLDNGQISTPWNAFIQSISDQLSTGATTTNDDAAAGDVGEFMSAQVLSGAAVALATGVTVNVTSLSLTGGDWDVSGVAGYKVAGTTSFRGVGAGLTATSAAMPDPASGAAVLISTAAQVPGASLALAVGPVRFSLATTATIYLVAFGAFTVSSMAAYGFIRARRMR